MGYLNINQEKIDAGIAKEIVSVCPFGAISYAVGKIGIGAACRMCRLCVKKYGGYISYIEEEKKGIDKSLWKGIAVFIECCGGVIRPVSYELIGKALELGKKISTPVFAVIAGFSLEGQLETLTRLGLSGIYVYDNACLRDFRISYYTHVIEDFINKIKPAAVFIGATNIGRALAPRAAARFRTGLTADCTQLDIRQNTDIVQIRPAFGGNIMAQIVTANSRPQFCTVRYKVFSAPAGNIQYESPVYREDIKYGKSLSGIKVLKTVKKQKSANIEDADIIVAVGRGVKTVKEIEEVREFCDSIGGVLACSRPMVENGFFDNRRQIGLSGKTLKPKLIITIGISGAIQFVAGMQNSEYIIAVNSDENADIFRVCDLGIVSDYKAVLPRLKQLAAEKRGLK